MPDNSYQQLADHLNRMPIGFPTAPSGVEMKILRKLFSPEEARIASRMKLDFELPVQIAERLAGGGNNLSNVLETMLAKGLVNGRGPRENREFRLEPFINIHGDLALSFIDRDYVKLFEQYLAETFAEELGKVALPNIRVFPAEQAISADHTMLDFEQVSKMVEEAKNYVISDCPCCRKMKLLGSDCGRRAHRCISLYHENDFRPEIRIEYREGRRATQEEALSLLKTAEEEGFIHTASNIQNGHSHICNCCPDCCPFLRMIRLEKAPYIVATSNYKAIIDSELCNACGMCAEERCPVNAIEPDDESYAVTPERCIGCGACVLACPSGALSLLQNDEDKITVPPENAFHWLFHRVLGQKQAIEDSSQSDTPERS